MTLITTTTATNQSTFAPLQRPCQIAPRPGEQGSTTPHDDEDRGEFVKDQLTILHQLETTTYQRRDYLQDSQLPQPTQVYYWKASRQMTVEYFYQIVDYGKLQRHSVAYAMTHLLDRYLALDLTLLENPHRYQLAALTCLYMAVKLLDTHNIGLSSLPPLTNYVYQEHDFVQMEQTICAALEWRIGHGPLPVDFVRLLLQSLNPLQVNQETRDQLYQQAQYQLELSVTDYDMCVGNHASELAVTSLWNAVHASPLVGPEDSACIQQQILQTLASIDEAYFTSSQFYSKMANLQTRLQHLQWQAMSSVAQWPEKLGASGIITKEEDDDVSSNNNKENTDSNPRQTPSPRSVVRKDPSSSSTTSKQVVQTTSTAEPPRLVRAAT